MKATVAKFLLGCVAMVWSSAAGLAGTITYTHDPAGRLTAVSYGTNKFIAYTYTAAGDLTQRQFSVGAGGDTDGDGMDDAWEQLYFGNLSRNGTGDFDGDGMTDLAEFLAGTLPNNAGSVFKIIRVTPTPGVSALIEWTSVVGKTYRVQYKDSLSAPVWTDLPGDVTATTNTASKLDTTIGVVNQRLYRVSLGAGAPTSPPVLSVLQTNSQLLVSWPSSTRAGFLLETTTNLAPVIVWTTLTNVPSDDGTNKAVNLNISPIEPARFYRLRQ